VKLTLTFALKIYQNASFPYRKFKNFSGEGHSDPFPSGEGDTPPTPHPHALSAPAAPRFSRLRRSTCSPQTRFLDPPHDMCIENEMIQFSCYHSPLLVNIQMNVRRTVPLTFNHDKGTQGHVFKCWDCTSYISRSHGQTAAANVRS
jgi:hypothetical protein